MATLVGAALVAFAAPGDPLRLQYALALAVVCAAAVLHLLDLPAGVPRQLPLARRDGGLHHRPRHRGVHQPGAEDPRRSPRGATPTSGVLAAAERLKETMASSVSTEGYFVEVIALIHSIPRANLYSVAIGVSAFLIVRLMKRYAPKIPGALVALVLLTTARRAASTSRPRASACSAPIPSGAPALTLPAIPAGRLPAAAAGRPGDRGHPPLRRPAGGPQLQQQVRLQGRRRPDAVRLRRGQPGGRLHRVAASRATAPPARRRWMPRARAASCPAWWRPGRSRWCCSSSPTCWRSCPMRPWPGSSPTRCCRSSRSTSSANCGTCGARSSGSPPSAC